MMHDHSLHELHFHLRPWGEFCHCRRRQSLAGLPWRTRLNHYRPRRISLLCACSGKTRCEEHGTQDSECSSRAELKIQTPAQIVAGHLQLDESVPRNINILLFESLDPCLLEV